MQITHRLSSDSSLFFEVLSKFWADLDQRRMQRRRQWFQQDGATPHCTNGTLTWIKNHFQDRVISRRYQADWAPLSPDLNLLDFHLWGFLKDRVYENSPRTISDLKLQLSTRSGQYRDTSVNEWSRTSSVESTFAFSVAGVIWNTLCENHGLKVLPCKKRSIYLIDLIFVSELQNILTLRSQIFN